MPYYYKINSAIDSDRRAARGLLRLRRQLTSEIPKRSFSETLHLATWNIREFDSSKYGKRLREAMYYIAEIVSRFDLVAVQEVRKDLKALDLLKNILGKWWKYIVTDVTEGRRGNRERMAFLYDSRKVRFSGLAGEIVIPPLNKRTGGYIPISQLARTPFIAGFKAGWFKFMLCTVHILYGTSTSDDPERVAEIRRIAKFLADRAKDKTAWSRNLILLGDFNIFDTNDITFEALTDQGFVIPEELTKLPANFARKTKHYDQIAFMVEGENRPQLLKSGAVNFFKSVFRPGDEAVYKTDIGKGYLSKSDGTKRSAKEKNRYYREWRTHQMSDHLPMWVELKIDFGEEYLRSKSKNQ